MTSSLEGSQLVLRSRVGPLLLIARGGSLTGIYFGTSPGRPREDAVINSAQDAELLTEASHQLQAYFRGERRAFELPLAPRGTEFQMVVWQALRLIPYGETRSYSQLARAIGRPDAVRAVGAANGQNPISIVVPCHRVIGADGSLTGFGGGLPTKQTLLELEGALRQRMLC